MLSFAAQALKVVVSSEKDSRASSAKRSGSSSAKRSGSSSAKRMQDKEMAAWGMECHGAQEDVVRSFQTAQSKKKTGPPKPRPATVRGEPARLSEAECAEAKPFALLTSSGPRQEDRTLKHFTRARRIAYILDPAVASVSTKSGDFKEGSTGAGPEDAFWVWAGQQEYVDEAEADYEFMKSIVVDEEAWTDYDRQMRQSYPKYEAHPTIVCLVLDLNYVGTDSFRKEVGALSMMMKKFGQAGRMDQARREFSAKFGEMVTSEAHWCDLVYVSGGNPMVFDRKHPFWSIVQQRIENGEAWFSGRSAGSIWAGSQVHGKANSEAGHRNRAGLELIPKVVVPHYHSDGEDKGRYDRMHSKERHDHKKYELPIRDGEIVDLRTHRGRMFRFLDWCDDDEVEHF